MKTVCYREISINSFRWGIPFRLFLILIVALPVSASPTYEGKVVGISDGDTITVLVGGRQQLKVRLAEIDAPEKSQAFGQRSKQSLSDLAFGKQARVEQQDRDWYGRVVGKVYVGSLDVNAEQVRRGMHGCTGSTLVIKHCMHWRGRREAPNVAYGQIRTLSPLGSPGTAVEQTPQQKANPHKPWARQRQAAIINAALSVIATRWPLAEKLDFI